MKVTVHYFAGAKDAAGCANETFEVAQGSTIAQLREALPGARDRLRAVLNTCRFAQGDDFATEDEPLRDGETIYVLPPVSGGAGGGAVQSQANQMNAMLLTRSIAVGEAATLLKTQGSGAITTFCGIVRDHSKGRSVQFLDYEAHPPLAIKEMQRIAEESIAQHGLVDARVLHRIGHLEIGEVAVDIAVSSAHRKEGFDGCRYIIEELKKRVPIWKKETDDEGSEWVSTGP